MTNNNIKEMSLIEHITELRKRLLWSFVYILIIFVICFYFADQLFSLDPDSEPLAHYRAVEKLVEGAPNHPESLYILARAAKEAKLWGQARHYLNLLKGILFTQRVCRLMVEIEETENPRQGNQAHEWKERAITAPADPTWVCTNCHISLSNWQPICPSCDGFDQISWQTPGSVHPIPSQKEPPSLLG